MDRLVKVISPATLRRRLRACTSDCYSLSAVNNNETYRDSDLFTLPHSLTGRGSYPWAYRNELLSRKATPFAAREYLFARSGSRRRHDSAVGNESDGHRDGGTRAI
jgi:hypothetical protein